MPRRTAKDVKAEPDAHSNANRPPPTQIQLRAVELRQLYFTLLELELLRLLAPSQHSTAPSPTPQTAPKTAPAEECPNMPPSTLPSILQKSGRTVTRMPPSIQPTISQMNHFPFFITYSCQLSGDQLSGQKRVTFNEQKLHQPRPQIAKNTPKIVHPHLHQHPSKSTPTPVRKSRKDAPATSPAPQTAP